MSDFSIDNISGFSHFAECGGMDVCSDGNLCSIATGAIVIDERRSLNCNCFPKNKRRRDAPLFYVCNNNFANSEKPANSEA
jgi:hypothetical protein